jgi:Periplasmic copper-binding protein (NosD)
MRYLTVIRLAAIVLAVLACSLFAGAGRAALLIDVTNTNDAGPGSLRAAIATANGSSGKDTIRFFVTGTISLTSGPLPAVTDPVVIDGRTAPGYSGSPLVRVDNAIGSAVDGFEISAGSTELRALSITGFANAISLTTSGIDIVAGNWIGLDLSGSADGNDDGVLVGSSTNTIGGTTAADRNVISGNTHDGVAITGSGVTGNLVDGNYIGTNTAGTAAVANGAEGVSIAGGATSNTIGGTSASAGNVISGNGADGVLVSGAGTSGNPVKNNFVGTNAAGTAAVANGQDGVVIQDGATLSTIGNNVLSGNAQFGASLRGTGTTGNIVGPNRIGVAATSPTPVPNEGSGVGILSGASQNTIGGVDTTAGNLIGGNGLDGVQISGVGTSGNKVLGNDIGMTPDGTSIANGGSGLSIADGASANIVGGKPGNGFLNAIGGNEGNGVEITGSGTVQNTVAGNVIGVNRTFTRVVGNVLSGVLIAGGASNNKIGLGGPSHHNYIAGSGFAGVEIDGSGCARVGARFPSLGLGAAGNAVAGNSIGTSGGGPNRIGVAILAGASGNTVGSTLRHRQNDISGNTTDGVLISGCGTSSNTVEGNSITANNDNGVRIADGASQNTVGGVELLAANGISGNTNDGVLISDSGTSGNALEGNSISANGGNGVRITSSASQNTVGGVKDGARNVISGNAKQGVAIQAAAANLVQGNYVGTDPTGASAVPNGKDGISIFSAATGNLVGGTTLAARNVISGNTARGVTIGGDGTTGNLVQGNFVGTNAAGTAALANDTGIAVQRGASQNTVGGTHAGAGNVVSGNTSGGILLTDDGGTPPGSTSGNLIQGNLVGTDVNGTSAVPNGQFGVLFTDGPKSNTLGGTQAAARNTIAFNNGDGVRVQSPDVSFTTFGDSILGNAIFENAGLGISLLTGGNHLQPAPVIQSVSTSGGTTSVKGKLSGSAPSTQFRIELYSNPVCDSSGAGEGKDFLAAKTITTGTSGAKTFTINVPAVAPGLALTETATNLADGDTSEFSTCATSP